jgi:hypothetical protein
LVANVEFGDIVAFLDDGADELVAADEVWGAFQVATVEMEVRALCLYEFCWEAAGCQASMQSQFSIGGSKSWIRKICQGSVASEYLRKER